MLRPSTRLERKIAWRRSTARSRLRKHSQHETWRPSMPSGSLMLTLGALILSVVLLTGCGHRRTELIAAACPQPPLIPAALKQLPPEATLSWETLILEQFNVSVTLD